MKRFTFDNDKHCTVEVHIQPTSRATISKSKSNQINTMSVYAHELNAFAYLFMFWLDAARSWLAQTTKWINLISLEKIDGRKKRRRWRVERNDDEISNQPGVSSHSAPPDRRTHSALTRTTTKKKWREKFSCTHLWRDWKKIVHPRTNVQLQCRYARPLCIRTRERKRRNVAQKHQRPMHI